MKAVEEVMRGSYERPRLGFQIEAGDSWIDGGANIGAFSVYAAKIGARCVAIEAEKMNASLAKKNLALNKCRVEVRQLAVVGEQELRNVLPFYVSQKPGKYWRHSLCVKKDGAQARERRLVRTLRIESALHLGDCLKLDIEGAEIPLLVSLTKETASRIRKLVFEWSFDIEPRVPLYREVVQKLEKYFPHVSYAKSLPWDSISYPFFPPCTMGFAWR